MSHSIIEVNNLSKSYTISHEGRERYTALRDVMAQKAKKIFSFPKSLTSTLTSTLTSSSTREEFWALKDVSFTIEQGDRVGIIGRNGAGKSTLLKLLSRITEPTAGEIKIKGRVASLLEVGTGFHPELTGRENIFLNGAILGMSRAEVRKHFDAIVDFAEIEKFLDTPVKRYSSGMYVRLAFAVAAHLEPEILVIDEVLAVGDAQFQKKCLGKMEDVSRNEGRTVLFVSHNIESLKSICNSAILLANGKVKDIGDIGKVIHEYQSSFHEENTGISEYINETDKETPFICRANVSLTGQQPFHELQIDVDIRSAGKNRNGLFVIDIFNSSGICIYQVIPRIDPFIELIGQKKSYTVSIACTGLIPDIYYVSIWMGPGLHESYDWIKKKLSFEIVDSPVKGKLSNYTPGNGFIVPVSKISEK